MNCFVALNNCCRKDVCGYINALDFLYGNNNTEIRLFFQDLLTYFVSVQDLEYRKSINLKMLLFPLLYHVRLDHNRIYRLVQTGVN